MDERDLKQERTTTTIILINNYGKYEVSVDRVDLDIYNIMDDVIKPVLMASGFAEETIDKYLDNE